MSKGNPLAHVGPVEMIAEWEGPAIPAPGILLDEKQADYLAASGDVVAWAAWVAVTVLAGVPGNSTYEGRKTKVLEVLSDWRRRFGQSKVDEAKQRLFEEMQKYRKNRKITDEELCKRIQLLFDEIEPG